MTEKQINKNSPEYKTGYKSGLGRGLFVGVLTTLVIGGALYVHKDATKGNKTSNQVSNLEKALSSPEVIKASKELRESKKEVYDTIRFMAFSNNPDAQTQQDLEGCKTPMYQKKFNECYEMYTGLGHPACDGCVTADQAKEICNIVVEGNDNNYKKCKDKALEQGFKRYQEQKNIPQRK